MTRSQPSALHFLSAKTVLLSSLRIDNTEIVPDGPWSRAVSQTASLSRSEQSALIIHSVGDLRTTSRFVRTSLVNFWEWGCSNRWHWLMRSVDSILGKVRVLKTSALNVLCSLERMLWRNDNLAYRQWNLIVAQFRASRGTWFAVNFWQSACVYTNCACMLRLAPQCRAYV